VIATGGGIVTDDENLTLLREKTLLVGLTASTEAMLGRVGKNSKRPLLKGGELRERVEDLLKQRQSRYAQAHVTIDTSELSIDQVVEKIMQTVNAEN
jgi:shikimate kinase